MQDRIPVNPGRVLITPEDGSAAFYATMVRADNPTQEGTPLNKASLLKDTTAALFGLGGDAVPDDVLNAIKTLINGANANADAKAQIATGSYTGTGTFGSGKKNTLTFDFEPKLVLVQHNSNYKYYLLPMVSGIKSTGAFGHSLSSDYQVHITWSGKKVSWYNSEGADYQYNYSGTTYHYIAIG